MSPRQNVLGARPEPRMKLVLPITIFLPYLMMKLLMRQPKLKNSM